MYDQTQGPRKRIAIVGGGISGLSAAYYLAPFHDVTLFEAAPRLGGHARTVLAGKNGDQPVDTGFIVFNYVTYPYLTRLFRDLDVPVIKSEMSFGASINDGQLEYGLNTLTAILAQKGNLLRPQYFKMIADILRFGKRAEAAARDDDKTIGELVDELGLGSWFRNNYLMPMCGAIWSTPVAEVDRFPAKSLVQFFRNHALLAGSGEHQWWTVKGGSIEYVRRLEAALVARGCTLRTNMPVEQVQRDDFGVHIQTGDAQRATFDELILACHSDQTLKILGANATKAEASALGSIRYQANKAVLHCDTGQMPRRRACWSSWSYRSQDGDIGVTYWMNKLQGIPESDPLFVTLNPSKPIHSEAVYDEVQFHHPVFDKAALKAQQDIRQMQGQNHTWFAGAWNRHGFHEDGIASAMRIVRALTNTQQLKGMDHAFHEQSPEVEFPVDMRASA
ncbi:FAD-dependent oxidoreductase [Ruegeria pomeroyi]|jgi:predicted NAD/FAD-binding protein|uniref:Amine oxidase domain-containing protein n=2 Tax=Ruegeria pomeroyi TaxID=89184 RepID=Q5LTD2_RUEPO|nr:FAD-dependent oxidoreductase [Ruegeria pomeroyi]HCE71807.1 FAD-dependent oxidoreductase [Ruegeria sp.]AAV94769.1 cyclopropane fatty acyl phospholipid synthase [Ruegeria pomeroyi DSS-3]NVK95899.1 FAD-dependent oxidoreductase [Ruegeria pomeroyi]NVL00122.1 FAD-dependent oxidoreductase [Ruegeria pomeroyi]QWV08348.1 FAD-dependent oxidoreductase [Ruegeria pomeroyi]